MASKIVEHTGWAGRGPIKETGNKIWRDPTRRRASGEEEHNITTASNHENWNVFWFNYANWNVQKQRLRNSRDGRLLLLVLASPHAAISKWITDVGTTAISKLTKSAPWLANGLVVIVVQFVAKTQQPGTMRRNESMTDSQWRQCELYQRQTRALYSVSGFRTFFASRSIFIATNPRASADHSLCAHCWWWLR